MHSHIWQKVADKITCWNMEPSINSMKVKMNILGQVEFKNVFFWLSGKMSYLHLLFLALVRAFDVTVISWFDTF